jgi:hypothetical protein
VDHDQAIAESWADDAPVRVGGIFPTSSTKQLVHWHCHFIDGGNCADPCRLCPSGRCDCRLEPEYRNLYNALVELYALYDISKNWRADEKARGFINTHLVPSGTRRKSTMISLTKNETWLLFVAEMTAEIESSNK